MPEACVKVDNLKVAYNLGKPNEVRSLDGVSVEIFPEEYIIIFGPSGCGKSTLLYGISGLQAPTAGTVDVFGKRLTDMTKRETVEFHQTKVGMVFQAFYLIDTLTVIDNVLLPQVFRGDDLEEGKKRAMELLNRFGIGEHADKFPSQLSGGQKQRVSIARALINDPDIILADEPTGALDSESAKNVLGIFQEINTVDKKTLIMVTHNPEHLEYADRVILLKDGKKVEEKVNRNKRRAAAADGSGPGTNADGKGPGDGVGDGKMADDGMPADFRLLMRSFKGLTSRQVGSLLTPFKAKQLLNFTLLELTEEQVSEAEKLLNEFLSTSLDIPTLASRLDLDLEKGGAGWNGTRAGSFAGKIEEIFKAVEFYGNDPQQAPEFLTEYFMRKHHLSLVGETQVRMQRFIGFRLSGQIDRAKLQKYLDIAKSAGGVGLYKSTAEKISREVELILLLKYSG